MSPLEAFFWIALVAGAVLAVTIFGQVILPVERLESTFRHALRPPDPKRV